MLKFCGDVAECTGGREEPGLPDAQQAHIEKRPLEGAGAGAGEAPIADAFMLQALQGFDQVPLLLYAAAWWSLRCHNSSGKHTHTAALDACTGWRRGQRHLLISNLMTVKNCRRWLLTRWLLVLQSQLDAIQANLANLQQPQLPGQQDLLSADQLTNSVNASEEYDPEELYDPSEIL